MSVIVCTIYERDDPPVAGGGATALGTLDRLLHFSAREVLSTHGLNSVQIEVNRHDTGASLIQAGRWMTVAFPAIQATPVMTVRLGPSHTVLLGQQEGEEVIHVGGLGILSLAEDAKLLNTVHAPGHTCRGSCPNIAERWTWAGALADPITYGGIVVRGIEEGENQAGTPLAPLTLTFDRDNTSASTAWPDITATFQQPVGLSVLGLYRRIAEAGDVFLVENPDFSIDGYSAFGQGTFGTDRTSATYAAGKVRLFAAADNATSNLLTGLEEDGEDEPFTHVLVKGMGDVYAQVAASWYVSGPSRWASIEYRDTDDTDMLERVGTEWLRRQTARTTAREVEIMPGDDESSGRYLPWKHLHVGDLHTLTAGGVDESVRLVAFRVELVRGAHDGTTADAHRSLRVVCEYDEIGSTDGGDGALVDAIRGGEPSLCCGPRPPTPASAGTSVRLYHSGDRANTDDSPAAEAAPALTVGDLDAAWEGYSASHGWYRMMYTTSSTGDSGMATMPGPNMAVGDYAVRSFLVRLGDVSGLTAIIQGGGTVRGQNRTYSASGIGTDENAQDDVIETCGRLFTAAGVHVVNLWDVGDLTGTLKFAAQPTYVNRSFSGAFTAYASATDDHYLAVEYGAHHAGPTTGGSGFGLRFGGDTSDLPENQTETSDLRSWIEFATAGSAGDTPSDTVAPGSGSAGSDTGTYAPIDHTHGHGKLSDSGTRLHDASEVEYDPTTSALNALNLQDAIDELAARNATVSNDADFVAGALSNPPTQAEVETVIGSPGAVDRGTVIGLLDSGSTKRYLALSDGVEWHIVPLVTPRAAEGVSALTSAPDGGWAATQPAAYYNGVTYFAYVCGDNGNVELRTYTHATGTVSSPTVLHAALNADLHTSPSLVVRQSDHRIHAFYSDHAGAAMYQWISTNAEDISAGSETNIDSQLGGTGYTYPMVADLDSGLYLFVRHSGSAPPGQEWGYAVTTDDGATWSALVTFYTVSGRTAYPFVQKTGSDRVDVVAQNGSSLESDGSFQHFWFDAGNGAWKAADGSQLTLPAGEQSAILVWDGSTLDDTRMRGDVRLGADGHPRLLFATISGTTWTFRHARWTGSEWTFTSLLSDSEPSADGGCFDASDTNIIYLTDGDNEMLRLTTLDEATWSSEALTSATTSIYPVSPYGHAPDLPVLWLTGTYTSASVFSLGVSGYGLTDETVAAAHAQRIVFLDDTALDEAIVKRTSAGTWQVSRDDGTTWESLSAGAGHILIADEHATPLVFDDLLQNSAGDDLLYASE